MMRRTIILLAYAATGKSYAAARCPDRVLDMVAMPYKYHLPKGEVTPEEAEASKGTFTDPSTWNDEWPRNYVEAVEREADSGRWAYVLCPSDWLVLQMLAADGYAVHVVVPEPELKDEYRKRFADRGSVALAEHLIDNGAWERNIEELETLCDQLADCGCAVTCSHLGADRYLLNYM